jgi:head-tail adaptor
MIDVQQETTTVGAAMSVSKTWSTVKTLKGRVVAQESEKDVDLEKRAFLTTYKVYFSSNPGVTEKHRLKYGSRILWIRGTYSAHELNRLWVVMAEERTGLGVT